MEIIIIPIIFFVILYFVIKGAINNSSLAQELKEMKAMLQQMTRSDNREEAPGTAEDVDTALMEKCPACNHTVRRDDEYCSSCQLRLR